MLISVLFSLNIGFFGEMCKNWSHRLNFNCKIALISPLIRKILNFDKNILMKQF